MTYHYSAIPLPAGPSRARLESPVTHDTTTHDTITHDTVKPTRVISDDLVTGRTTTDTTKRTLPDDFEDSINVKKARTTQTTGRVYHSSQQSKETFGGQFPAPGCIAGAGVIEVDNNEEYDGDDELSSEEDFDDSTFTDQSISSFSSESYNFANDSEACVIEVASPEVAESLDELENYYSSDDILLDSVTRNTNQTTSTADQVAKIEQLKVDIAHLRAQIDELFVHCKFGAGAEEQPSEV